MGGQEAHRGLSLAVWDLEVWCTVPWHTGGAVTMLSPVHKGDLVIRIGNPGWQSHHSPIKSLGAARHVGFWER